VRRQSPDLSGEGIGALDNLSRSASPVARNMTAKQIGIAVPLDQDSAGADSVLS